MLGIATYTQHVTMHRCLWVQEIVCRIISELPSFYLSEKSVVLNIALTSKHFLEPGLDELWKAQYSLVQLVKCFPDDAWEIRRDVMTMGAMYGPPPVEMLYFTRPLVPEDWMRFIYYARRVRRLFNPWFSRTSVLATNDVWEMLATSRPPHLPVLLPNLKELTACESPGVFPHLRLLLAPGLQCFNLTWTGMDNSKLSLLSVLPTICPQLSRLELNHPPRDAAIIGDALQRYTFLSVLHLGNISYKTLELAAALPSLKDLSVDMALLAREHLSLEPGAFPNLERMRLENVLIPMTTHLLSTIHVDHLQHLFLKFLPAIESDHNGWARLTSVLKRFRNSLTSLAIHDGSEEHEHGWQYADSLEPAALLQLCQLTKLRCLVITSREIDVNNDTLKALSEALPDLHELELSSPETRHRPAKPITLDGLLPLTLNCPKLERLTLYIDATVIPCQLSKNHDRWKPNPNLTYFGTTHSPIASTIDVACFLCRLFPELRSILAFLSVTPSSRLWDEVTRHLRVVHQLRHDCEVQVKGEDIA